MAGPNGSGKSTILKAVRNSYYSGPFVNADDIQKSFEERNFFNPSAEFRLELGEDQLDLFLQNEGKSWLEKAERENIAINLYSKNGILLVREATSAYDAAIAADFLRYRLLAKEETFTFETVLSYAKKVDFLRESKAKGYKNYLYFICTGSPDINIERVQQRVKKGGHAVPEEKIKKRYYESLKLLPYLIPLCHRVFLFDNSSSEQSIDPVVEIDSQQRLTFLKDDIPWWIEEYVINKLYSQR